METERDNRLERILKWIAWATTAVAVLYLFAGLLINGVFFGILAIAAWVGVSKLSKKDE